MAQSLFGARRSSVFDPFSLDIWDPFVGFYNSVASVPSSAQESAALANARVDWKETPKVHIIKADLPGLKKEKVKVEVEDCRILQISGESTREVEDKNDKWHRFERVSGKFLRVFRPPDNARMDEITATMENRVLTAIVTKEEVKKPVVKAIDISV